MILDIWESKKKCYNFNFLRFCDLKSCAASCEYQKVRFFQNQIQAFFRDTLFEGTDMLPKRSAPIDRNLGSESMHSHLSVAIFIAPRDYLIAQKALTEH